MSVQIRRRAGSAQKVPSSGIFSPLNGRAEPARYGKSRAIGTESAMEELAVPLQIRWVKRRQFRVRKTEHHKWPFSMSRCAGRRSFANFGAARRNWPD